MNNNLITSKDSLEILFKENKKLENCAIEIINSCIFKCDHCYMPNSKNQVMDFKIYKKIIDELYDMECLWILLTGGETLLHPKFKEFYIYAKERGFLVSVNTNGYLINNDILELLIKYKPYIMEISLYGYDNDSYENFTHYKNAFTKINKNINDLIDNNINISLKTVLTKKNYKYIDKLKKYASYKNIPFRYDYIVFPKIDSKLNVGNKERLPIKTVISVLKNDKEAVCHFEKKISNMGLEKNNNSKNVFECTGGEDGIYIDSFGNINMCVVLINNKYNIQSYSIKEAQKEFIKFKKFKYDNENNCKRCIKKSICRYCPGRFLLETGDYQVAPKWYCVMAKEIINSFDLENKLYNKKHKIPVNRLKEIFKILVKNNKIIDNNFELNKKDYLIWKNNIVHNQVLNTYIIIENDKSIGYIQFIKENKKCCICEIQIDNNHKGDHKTFKKLIQMMLIFCDVNYDFIIYGNINSNNYKSKEVFTKIGFCNVKKNRYEISGDNILKWVC